MRQVLEYLHLKRPPAKFYVDNASMQAVCTKITGATKRLILHINFVLERTKPVPPADQKAIICGLAKMPSFQQGCRNPVTGT